MKYMDAVVSADFGRPFGVEIEHMQKAARLLLVEISAYAPIWCAIGIRVCESDRHGA